jgi:hypothetical protein
MIKRKNSAKILAGLFLCSAVIAGVGVLPNQVAKSYESDEFQISQWGGGGWPQPTYRGAPARTIGGGTRGDDCIPENAPEPTALIPTNNVWTTLSSQPKFFWYVPSTQAKSAEFVVLDENGKEVYQQEINFDLSQVKTGTIIEENLPPDVSLETGKVYTWQLSLICNPQRRSGDIFREGWVERVNLEADQLNQLQTNLKQAGEDSWKQAEAYLNAGIYNEVVSLLAKNRCNYQTEWQQLLTWMDLAAQVRTDTIAQCAVQNN